MATTNANQVQLKGEYVYEEYVAGAAIVPGELVEIYNDAGVATVRRPAGASGSVVAPFFAVEDPLQPKSADSVQGRNIGDAYADGEVVRVHMQKPGNLVQGWLADGESVVIGDPLMVETATGSLLKWTATNHVVGFAEEVLDLSATATTARQRINIRIA